jgi:hypothetical protein
MQLVIFPAPNVQAVIELTDDTEFDAETAKAIAAVGQAAIEEHENRTNRYTDDGRFDEAD